MATRHIHNLDALRAIAVLLVMLFHARFVSLGWVGVWLFFVLSGFLITRSLITLCGQPVSLGLRVFYLRRSLRIWPAYYAYLLAAGALIAAGLFPRDLWSGLLLSAVYLFNLSPLTDVVDSRVFGHLWSLAVEEQYYLLIAPLVLLLGPRRTRMVFAAGVLGVPLLRLAAFPALAGWLGPADGAQAVQMLTPFQLDSFMLGGLLALYEDAVLRMPAGRFALLFGGTAALAVAALAANAAVLSAQGAWGGSGRGLDFSAIEEWRLSSTSLGMGVGPHENWGHVWMYSALNVIALGAIAGVMRGLQGVRLPGLNAIGRVSYGMYLYHSVLVSALDRVVGRLGVPKHSLAGWAAFVVFAAVTYAVSAASYAWLETPFLRLKDRISVKRRPAAPMVRVKANG